MVLLRSLLLALVMLVLTPFSALIACLSFPLPALTRYRIIRHWADVVLWVLKNICGIKYQVLGKENIPDKPCIILSKHQSAWETIAFQQIFPPISFVLKRELLRIPFFGWGLALFSVIAIDRAAGADALTQVAEQGKQRLDSGFSVIVFPEGTRVAIGTKKRFKPGGAWLAEKTGAPVIPVAHNAGECWRRNAFLKYPGTITVSIGPAIDSSRHSAAEVNKMAQDWVEKEMRRLFPHHYS